jgi:hypothetical protein
VEYNAGIQTFIWTLLEIDFMLGTAATQAEVELLRRNQIQPHQVKGMMNELLEDLCKKTAAIVNQQRQEEYIQATHLCLAAAEMMSRMSLQGQSLPPSQPAPGNSAQYISPQQLLDCVSIPDLVSDDLEHVAAQSKAKVPEVQRARSEQLIRTRQVRDWMSAPASSQLLIHGDYDRRAYISGLTLFCKSLAESLAERAPRLLRVLFFCGLHVDPPTINGYSGGRAMIQSFICQLLCQHDFSGRLLHHQISQDRIHRGDIDESCELFELLVRNLPSEVVLFCIVDGIIYYEREEFKEDMERVLRSVLQVSSDNSTSAAVKVLITSPTKTTDVRKPFPEHLILSMGSMAQAGAAASGWRLKRELQAELE